MKSTFSALMEAPDKTDTFVIEKGYGRKKKDIELLLLLKMEKGFSISEGNDESSNSFCF